MDDGLTWLMAVNLVVWTGLFLYLLRLHRQVRRLESAGDGGRPTPAAGEGRGR